MSTGPVIHEVHRLTKESYEQLEKQVSNAGVNSQTTPTEAAFKLGIQYVLQQVRQGWVIG